MEKKAVALTHRYSLMFLFCTCGASVLNVLLLTSGFVNFLLEFVLGDGARQMKGTSFLFNRQVFLIDFYVFCIISKEPFLYTFLSYHADFREPLLVHGAGDFFGEDFHVQRICRNSRG